MARRIRNAWWARLTFNGITRYGNGATYLMGGDELSDNERDEPMQLCRQRLDGFREQRGEEVFAHHCKCCGAHEHQRGLGLAPIIPRN